MNSIVPIENLKQEISLLADQCVKCGLCSAKCPTYKLHADENESPRGRIALAQAIASNSISTFDRARLHLDNCLYCQQCETSCPSAVKYTQILDSTLEVLHQAQTDTPKNKMESFAIKFISQVKKDSWPKFNIAWKLVFPVIKNQLFKKYKLNPKILSRRNKFFTSFVTNSVANSSKIDRKKITFFTGCASHLFDKQTLEDSISLLTHYGYQVNIPKEQGCCGALAKHRGFSEVYKQCETTNSAAFDQSGANPIIYSATGCGATLNQYSSEVSKRFIDINKFISDNVEFRSSDLLSLKKKVIIHSPCSQQKSINKHRTIEKLLQKIPDLEIIPLEYASCCGAGGSHFIRNPETAAQIRTPLIKEVKKIQEMKNRTPDYIVSSNYSCAMHIASGLIEKEIDIPVIHPISLLWKQTQKQTG